MKYFWISAPLLSLVMSQALGKGMDDFEWGHELSIGAGVSSPANTTAINENPAGLVYNHQLKFVAQGATSNLTFNPMGLGALAFLGNGSVGAGIGVQTFNGTANSAGTIGELEFGVAAEADSINLAFGATGNYTLFNVGNSFGIGATYPWDVNVGFIYNPRGAIRAGLTGYQLLGGTTGIGLGVAWDPSSWSTLTVDTTKDLFGSGISIMPALGIYLPYFQIAYGYGFAVIQGNSWLRLGSNLAVGINFGPVVHFEFYFNHLAQYYAALTFKI